MTVRILIADDHALMRTGLCSLLEREPDMEIVGEAEDGKSALRLADEIQPDLVLMDISMPDMTGIEATNLLKKKHPWMKVLILTMHEDASLLRAAIQAGASGYILKNTAEVDVIHGVHRVMKGEIYIHPMAVLLLIKDMSPRQEHSHRDAEALTVREIEILRMLAKGYTNRQIADVLNLSIRTVEGHRANVVGKLGIHSRIELANYAQEHSLFA